MLRIGENPVPPDMTNQVVKMRRLSSKDAQSKQEWIEESATEGEIENERVSTDSSRIRAGRLDVFDAECPFQIQLTFVHRMASVGGFFRVCGGDGLLRA